jgi:glutathione S-transferase
MMQLYFSPNSPYARKVRIVMLEKGLPFEGKVMDTASPPAEFVRHNPNLRVPVLLDGGRTLFESNLIVDYLLRSHPAQGAGSPPLAGALTRPERHWEDSTVLNVVETMLDSGINLYQLTVRSGVNADKAAYLRKERERIQSCLDWLEARATPEGFTPGVFSIADLNLVCALTWAEFRKPFDWAGRPRLAATVDRYRARPSVNSTQPG